MRALLAATVLLTALLGSCATVGMTQSHEPKYIRIREEVIQFLDRMHTEFEGEIVMCLTGHASGDTVVVTGIEPAEIVWFTRTRVHWNGCDGRNVQGVMHNHPDGTCRFSGPDMVSFAQRRRDKLALLSCGNGIFAWRLRDGSSGIQKLTGA